MFHVVIILSTALLIQAQDGSRLVPVKSAGLGDNVTLSCGVTKEFVNHVHWFKQVFGYYPQMVASRAFDTITIWQPFGLRFTAKQRAVDFNLMIENVNNGDEANYFCTQLYSSENWTNCIFLSIKEHKDHRFVIQTVVQQPESASVQLGDPVALQCSVTSKRRDHRNQCQGDPSVYWFRSGSEPSDPTAIYMNGNRSGECQDSSGSPSAPQSCVYTLPKNNVVTSDAGTYYCALAACGDVVFGHGTKLDIKGLDLSILVHRILLACCVLVILILILIIHCSTVKRSP